VDTDAATLTPQVLGRAEHAHRALLERILAGTGLTYPRWVALGRAAGGGAAVERDQLVARLAGALQLDDAAAREAIAALAAARLLEPVPGAGSRVRLTAAGRDQHRRLRAAVQETVTRLYRDIPADDLATAGRVLTVITARANAELARA
jgi:DNA-binding MarR family transcriptional regulator